MRKYKDIENFYQKDLRSLFYAWYVKEKKSANQISEIIQKNVKIKYTPRAVHQQVVKFDFNRSQSASMKNRVIMGRMDFRKRKTDYKKRVIDYEKRELEKGNLWAVGLSKYLDTRISVSRLAWFIEAKDETIFNWLDLKGRTSSVFQEKVCRYLKVEKNQIFSEKNSTRKKNKSKRHTWNVQEMLVNNHCYRYAANLKKIMYERGLTISELAKKLRKPQDTISRYCSGERVVSLEDQARILKILNVPTDSSGIYLVFCDTWKDFFKANNQ